jgi:hypothetical protein
MPQAFRQGHDQAPDPAYYYRTRTGGGSASRAIGRDYIRGVQEAPRDFRRGPTTI